MVLTDVVQVTPNIDFRILIADVGKHPKILSIVQSIAFIAEHLSSMMEYPLTHGEVLGVAVENLYRKRPCDAKAKAVVNGSLARNKEHAFGEKQDEPIAA